MQQPLFRLETQTSQPIEAGNTTVQLTTQVFQIRFPFLKNGGLIYHRPVSVTVQPGTENELVVPVVDVTRLAQIGLFMCTLLTALIMSTTFRRRKPVRGSTGDVKKEGLR